MSRILIVAGLALSACGTSLFESRPGCSDAAVIALDDSCDAMIRSAEPERRASVLADCERMIREQSATCGWR